MKKEKRFQVVEIEDGTTEYHSIAYVDTVQQARERIRRYVAALPESCCVVEDHINAIAPYITFNDGSAHFTVKSVLNE